MPKQLAIKLSWKTVSRISYHLDIPETEVQQELYSPENEEEWYYVTNYRFRDLTLPHALCTKQEFQDLFASMPPGIEDRFVPVTQIKD